MTAQLIIKIINEKVIILKIIVKLTLDIYQIGICSVDYRVEHLPKFKFTGKTIIIVKMDENIKNTYIHSFWDYQQPLVNWH
jgi:hypothetical protein